MFSSWQAEQWHSYYEEDRVAPWLIKTKRSPILFYILQSPILNIDIAPTIVELAGGKAPESMDGRSILPLLVRY